MYLSHYQLRCKPFQISSDPTFLWQGEKHKEAFAILRYGILDNKGFLLLTGDVGTGKTTLINALVNSLGTDVIVATVPDPNLTILDFFNYIAAAFGSVTRFQSKGEFLQYFNDFLHTAYRNGKKTLLIIDEAQRLNHELLEEIRVLSNIEKQSTKLLNIFFVGQDEFNGFLWEDRNRALRQRITINYHVDALNQDEMHSYIEHRLKVAGTEKKIFSKDAIREIMTYSGGFPRTVNILCDHALLTGYVKGSQKIDREIIRECAEDLRIPEYRYPRSGKTPDNHSDTERHDSNIEKEAAGEKPADHARIRKSQNLLVPGILIVFLFLLFLFIMNERKQSEGLDVRNTGNQTAETATRIPLLYEDMSSGNRPSESEKVVQEASPGNFSSAEEHDGEVHAGKQSPMSSILKNKIIIPFSHNSDSLSEQDRKELERVVHFFKQNPDVSVDVVGYTDSSGPNHYNQYLSLQRAEMIKSFLVESGIGSRRIATYGMGAVNPMESNETPEGRRLNRRVELEFAGNSR
ncbi:MAG: AAA family ATPase [Desulfobacteraceae bacterium]|nr:MAG: AAA family ATPase [Desulfobacteraceae bacterium]